MDGELAGTPFRPLRLHRIYRLRVERAFVRDMHAFFAEKASIKRDAIAARQMSALRQYQQPREKPVRIPDVKEMFLQMRDHA